MSNETIRQRLQFVGMDDEMRAVLRGMKPLIIKALAPVLDELYQLIAVTSEVGLMFQTPERMKHAKEAQINHWGFIASGEFSDAYVASVTKIGEVHNKLGLEPRWYIGGYSRIMGGVLAAIEADVSGWSRNAKEKKAKMIRAFVTAAMLD